MAEVYYVEGSDYTGKTTFISNLSKYITGQGKKVLVLKEPNGFFREELLNSDKDLSFFERRLFFLTCHFQTRELISSELDNYDYIIVDRCAVVSDMMHIELEKGSLKEIDHIARVLRRVYNSLYYMQELTGTNFDSHLVLLSVDEDEFERRVSLRAADIENTNDLKGMDFKRGVYNAYKEFIYGEDSVLTNLIKDFFYTIHVLDSDCEESKERAKKFYNTIMRGDK